MEESGFWSRWAHSSVNLKPPGCVNLKITWEPASFRTARAKLFDEAASQHSKARPRQRSVPRYSYQKGQHSSEKTKELLWRLEWTDADWTADPFGPFVTSTWTGLAGEWASAPWCAPAACQCSPPDLWPAASASSALPPASPANTSAARTPPSASPAPPPAASAGRPVHCGSGGSTSPLPRPQTVKLARETGRRMCNNKGEHTVMSWPRFPKWAKLRCSFIDSKQIYKFNNTWLSAIQRIYPKNDGFKHLMQRFEEQHHCPISFRQA